MAPRWSNPSGSLGIDRFRVWPAGTDSYSHTDLAQNWDTLDGIIGIPSTGDWPPTTGIDGGIYEVATGLQTEIDNLQSQITGLVVPPPVVVADTVSGLGTREAGKVGIIRISDANQDSVLVVCDGTTWVSMVPSNSWPSYNLNTAQTGGYNFRDYATKGTDYIFWKKFATAGLSIQTRHLVTFYTSYNNPVWCELSWCGRNLNTTAGETGFTGIPATELGGLKVLSLVDSGWQSLPGSPSPTDVIRFIPGTRWGTSFQQDNYGGWNGLIYYRWVG